MNADWLFTLLGAELVFLLTRSRDFLLAFKKASQRTPDEQQRVDRGLLRSLVIETALLVPASAVLLSLIAPASLFHLFPSSQLPHDLSADIAAQKPLQVAEYTLMGVVSYGFPFGAVKRTIVVVALGALKAFAGALPIEGRSRLQTKQDE